MMRLLKYYHIINTLSLDVAIGAVVSAMFLAKVLSAQITFVPMACLGLVVWLIYTADHLLDAKRTKGNASTYRHSFHQRHFNSITICFVFFLALVVTLLFYIQTPILIAGTLLTIFIATYFIFQHQLLFLKEFFGSVLYTSGILLPILATSSLSYSLWEISIVSSFTLLALINLVLFSWFDIDQDRMDKHPSLAIRFGAKTTEVILYILFGIQAGLMVYATLTIGESLAAIGLLAIMNLSLFIIFKKAGWFAIHDRYRMAGDAIFIFPIVYLLYA